MKRRLKQIVVLLMVSLLLLTAAGCTEKYYNGDKAVLGMSEDDEEKFKPTVETILQILTEGIDTEARLLAKMGSNPAEIEINRVKSGYSQYVEAVEKYGQPKNTYVSEMFYYCYHYAALCMVEFEGLDLMVDMMFDGSKNLENLDFYISPETDEKGYVLPEGVAEKQLVIGEGTEYALGATLTYPEGASNVPAVLLVQGIGDNDRDQTGLSTKMFRDIANGLAQQGIAVLRFDTRMYTYTEIMDTNNPETLTIDFQRIDDVVLAAELLRQQEMVDASQVYMVGHDLGGLLSPRIDLQCDFAGLCIVASPSRDWSESAYAQTMDYGLNGIEQENMTYIKGMLDVDIENIRKIADLKDEDALSIYLNNYAIYWKDLNQYDYPSMVASLDKKVMVIQGDQDYQMPSDVEYAHWKELLEGKSNVTLKLYEGLNHMMMKPEGIYTNVSRQYLRPLKVDAQVITDIAQWVKS